MGWPGRIHRNRTNSNKETCIHSTSNEMVKTKDSLKKQTCDQSSRGSIS